ncbi:MAG: hypothetical protein AAF705_19380 [Bacteroidota bacterium]
MNCTKAVKKASIKRFNSLLFLLFACTYGATAQISTTTASPYHILGKSIVELKQESTTPKTLTLPILLVSDWSTNPTGPIPTEPTYLNYQAPKAYNFNHLAFFCRLEVRMEKATKMPVRFRLGTVDYVDRLEGKY